MSPWMPGALLLAFLAAGPLAAQGFESAVLKKVEGQVLMRLGEGDWEPATEGARLRPKDDLGTGPESEALLEFPDGSVAGVKELTQLSIGTLLATGDSAKIRLLLRLGEIEAEVPRQEGVKSDFSVATPVSTASVRGTRIRKVGYTPSRGFYTELKEGRLQVKSATEAVELETGFEAAVEPDGEMLADWQIGRDDSRIALEPGGLSEREVERVELSMEPEPFPQESTSPSEQEDSGSTFLLRLVLE